tara:strand:+ start:13595 stop:13951 length:357 start_codon:yes stop_codon:yes gene_type:complete
MTIGEQLQDMYEGVDQSYKLRFVAKTQKLLDDKVNEIHTFLDASLTFQDGSAVWRQDLLTFDSTKRISSTNPLINPEILAQSAEHAYDLFKEYYTNTWFSKKDAYERGIDDLEKYCNE